MKRKKSNNKQTNNDQIERNKKKHTQQNAIRLINRQ